MKTAKTLLYKFAFNRAINAMDNKKEAIIAAERVVRVWEHFIKEVQISALEEAAKIAEKDSSIFCKAGDFIAKDIRKIAKRIK